VKIITSILAIVFFCQSICAQKRFNLEIVVDGSYTGSYEYIDSVIAGVNKYFGKYDLEFWPIAAGRKNVLSDSKDLERSLYGIHNLGADITIAVVGDHKGLDIGVSFVGGIGGRYSTAIVDLQHTTYSRTVLIVAHEICHIFGLEHSSDRYNLMNHYTIGGELTPDQLKVLSIRR
jgi:hypothetical protein